MRTKEDVINQLIKDNGYKSFLEIGYQDGHCYNQIECKYKIAVDPGIIEQRDDLRPFASDDFFSDHVAAAQGGNGFDIVLIDGLHHADQVRKDITNAAKYLSENGCIIIHDVNPSSEEMQEVPRNTKVWTGDCWRAMVGFRKKYPEIVSYTHAFDYGIGVIFPAGKKFRAHFEDMETSYQDFNADREVLLGIARD